MKRKLAALITLIAFAVTMIPSMAFAEDTTDTGNQQAAQRMTTGDVDVDSSYFETVDDNDDNDNLKLTNGQSDNVAAKFALYKNDGRTKATGENDVIPEVYIWAVAEGSTTPSSALNVAEGTEGDIANTYVVKNVKNLTEVNLTFSREGTYTIYAGADLTAKNDAESISDLTVLQYDSSKKNVVVVKDDSNDVAAMYVSTASGFDWKVLKGASNDTIVGYVKNNADLLTDVNNAKDKDGNRPANEGNFEKAAVLTESANTTAEVGTVNSNGVAKQNIKIVLTNDQGQVLKNEDVKISTNSANLQANKTEETTDRDGMFGFKLSATKAGDYKVYIDSDDFNGVLKVKAGSQDPNAIEVTKEPTTTLDKDDTNWDKAADMGDEIQIEVRDSNGYLIDGNAVVANAAGAYNDRKDYISIVSQPEDSDFDGEDFQLVPVPGEDYMTVIIGEGAKHDYKDLENGTYTLKIALDNGATDTVTFKVGEFDEATALDLQFDTETVALGETFSPSDVKVVDANGVSRKVKESDNVTFGYNGYALESFEQLPVVDGQDNDYFKAVVSNDEKYLGSSIVITAVSSDLGLSDSKELTVANDGQSISFDPLKGEVGEDNTVNAQLVDGDGKSVAPGKKNDGKDNLDDNDVTVYVVNQTNPEAKVDVEVDKTSDLSDKGQFKLTVTSDKETEAEIAAYVKSGNGKIYANNFTYNFGAAAPSGADLNVVMTIDSPETIVNNKIVTIDAAPYVNADYRTMVPIRALAEDFGATVDWNADTQTVTVKLDGNTVEMTIGSTTYKVNGTEKTMDTAPVINDGRTFVPVRFVAEALGFKVTPTYNADGTTASVVFAR